MKSIYSITLAVVLLTGCSYTTKTPLYTVPQPVQVTPAPQAPKPVKKAPVSTPKPSQPAKAPAISVPKGTIVIYGASWCGPCKELKLRLDRKAVKYTYIDVETQDSKLPNDGSALAKQIMSMIDGVPVVVNLDGTVDRGDKIRAAYPF